jgi:hypothetical protein
MPCRICLEDNEPFIHPCYCSGTAKDVHEDCLLRWINISRIWRCEICHAPLSIEYDHLLEQRAYLDRNQLQILTNPAFHILIHCLIMITFMKMLDFFLQFQLMYNVVYMGLLYCFIKKKVQNKTKYLVLSMTFPYILIPLGNIFLWIKFIESHEYLRLNISGKPTNFIILSIINQAYMGICFLLHNHILDQINNNRRPIIVPRHILANNH